MRILATQLVCENKQEDGFEGWVPSSMYIFLYAHI